MIFRLVAICLLSGAAFFAGCTSAPRPAPVVAPVAEPVKAVTPPMIETTAPVVVPVPAPEPVVHKKSALSKPVTPTIPTLKPGEYALLVESEPAGATVVVNGRPCGKTPCRIVVQANGRGFLREQVSIKVRFIAASEGLSSQTVEDLLTTLDKVPTEIRFTMAGATRVVR